MENCCLGAPSLCQFCLRSLQLSSGNKKGVNGNIKRGRIFSNQQSDDFNLYGLTSLHERPRRGNRNKSDEVGFVHPSQFFKLNEEAGHSLPSSDSSADGNSVFWNKDHKLGISTQVLLPLYKASKDAFMTANRQFKELNSTSGVSGAENSLCSSLSLDDSIESAIMKHSRALLLLSCDFSTAWHSRKLVVLEKHKLSALLDELLLSALVLSYSPKSEYAWGHRKWVIKSISEKCSTLPEIVTKESELVEKIAEVYIQFRELHTFNLQRGQK